MDKTYKAPTIATIGTLQELTMHPRGKDKVGGPDSFGLMPDHIMGGSLGGGRPGGGHKPGRGRKRWKPKHRHRRGRGGGRGW